MRKLDLLVLVAVAVPGFMAAQSNRKQDEFSVRHFLDGFDKDLKGRFVDGFIDLNGDGRAEAIVHLTSNDWCGSGGCTTLVLVRDGDSWRVLTKITITSPPIRVLTSKTNGWRSIAVWVEGGGISPGYEAELRFNGRNYPSNPSVAPARRVTGEVAGTIVIPKPPFVGRQEPQSAKALTPSLDAHPSFDCSKANTPSERLVCRDPELAALDRTLSAVFRGMVGQLTSEDALALRRDQAEWFKTYAHDCNSAASDAQRWDCIDARLRSRIEQLKTMERR